MIDSVSDCIFLSLRLFQTHLTLHAKVHLCYLQAQLTTLCSKEAQFCWDFYRTNAFLESTKNKKLVQAILFIFLSGKDKSISKELPSSL